MSDNDVRWRTSGVYVSTLSSKATLIDETRIFLRVFARLQNLMDTCQALIEGELPHSSRQTRIAIVKVLRVRFVHWNPPVWVLLDLLSLADEEQFHAFVAVLLLHIARQDSLFYTFIQQVIVPRWYDGSHAMIPADVQIFLDQALEEHLEVAHWSYETRKHLSSHALTILRDCGLLKGVNSKHIVTPIVPQAAAAHLVRLLRAEGITDEQLAIHPDWRLWLWEPEQVRVMLRSCELREQQQ